MAHLSRTFMLCLTMISMVLLSACASAGNPALNSGESTAPATTSSDVSKQGISNSQETKIVKTANGDVKIPVNPQRIVALQFVGDLLAIGVKPVGTVSIILQNSELIKDELTGISDVGEPSVEKILELQPDLIIAPTYLEPKVIEQLSKIAPTVTVPWAEIDPLDEVKMFGEILGKQEQAEQWIAKYKQKVDKAKQDLSGMIKPGETVSTYEIWAKRLFIPHKKARAGYNLYQMLGVTAPDKMKREVVDTGDTKDISLEVLPEYAGDHIFVSVYEEEGGAERAKQIMDDKLWKSLPAVKSNKVYPIKLKEFWFTDGISLERQLDVLVKLLLERNKK